MAECLIFRTQTLSEFVRGRGEGQEAAGPGESWAAAAVGRIPYLAWNWELARWMEKVGRKRKKALAGLAFIPPPLASPRGQEQASHAPMPEGSPTLGWGTCPLKRAQPRKGATPTPAQPPSQLLHSNPGLLVSGRLGSQQGDGSPPRWMEKLRLIMGQCLGIGKSENPFQGPQMC